MCGGGTSKCAYQIGFMRALLEYISRDEIVAIAGASMGSFSAYALSANKIDEYERLFMSVNVKNITRHTPLVRRTMKDICRSYIRSSDVLDIPVAFPTARFPLWDTKYCWIFGRANYLWRRYMRSEITLPFLSRPVWLDGKFTIDGGAVDNIPIFPLLNYYDKFDDKKFDLIIALHFDARYDYRAEFYTDVPILDMDLSICNNFTQHHFDFTTEYVREMIDTSYIYGKKICEQLFTGECEHEDMVRKVNKIFLDEHDSRMKHKSIERVISCINVVGKLLRKDSDCIKYLF